MVGGKKSGRPPASYTERTYESGTQADSSVQTPQRISSAYEVIPISGLELISE